MENHIYPKYASEVGGEKENGQEDGEEEGEEKAEGKEEEEEAEEEGEGKEKEKEGEEVDTARARSIDRPSVCSVDDLEGPIPLGRTSKRIDRRATTLRTVTSGFTSGMG